MSNSKTILTKIKNSKEVGPILIDLLYYKTQLTYEDKEYLYTFAHLLIDEYSKDKYQSNFLIDYAYYIISKVAIKSNDYVSLYDFSVNYGYYPIAKKIFDLKLIEQQKITINYLLSNAEIGTFIHENKIVTYEQKMVFEKVLKDENKSISFIAPTSYGKSEIIFNHIKQNSIKNYICIIVPTKSLINQVYNDAKKRINDRRILIHDQNFDVEQDQRVLAIVTQERALRLLDEGLVFDVIYIDEAHEMFRFDYRDYLDNRSLLITRFISISRMKNPNIIELYLSPVISDANNLKIMNGRSIKNYKITKDLKILDVNYLNLSNELYKYDIFLNEYIKQNNNKNKIEYILSQSQSKNLHYLYRPVFIEVFAEKLYKNLYTSYRPIPKEILELSEELKEIVHPHFKLSEYLKTGIVYLHADIPNMLKNYLMKFINKSSFLKHIIANNVILAGINLPIDNIFYYSGVAKTEDLLNLVGRANRLNEIFNPKNKDLSKIFIPIHFIESMDFPNYRKGQMKNIIMKFRDIHKDEIKNPILENADTKDNQDKADVIIKIEEKVASSYYNPEFEELLVKFGIQKMMNYTKQGIEKLKARILTTNRSKIFEENLLEVMSDLFVRNYTTDEYNPGRNVERLKHVETINYYKMFISDMNKLSFRSRIDKSYNYWIGKDENGLHKEMYVGKKYGEYKRHSNDFYKTYIKITDYVDRKVDLYNLLIIKQQLDEDFVSYQLNLFLNGMVELGLITQRLLDEFIFGVTEDVDLKILRQGLNRSLYKQLANDDMIKNIDFDNFGNIKANKLLINYIKKQKGIIKFQLEVFFT